MQNDNSKEYQVATAYTQYNQPNFSDLSTAKEYTKQLRNKGIEFSLWEFSGESVQLLESWN